MLSFLSEKTSTDRPSLPSVIFLHLPLIITLLWLWCADTDCAEFCLKPANLFTRRSLESGARVGRRYGTSSAHHSLLFLLLLSFPQISGFCICQRFKVYLKTFILLDFVLWDIQLKWDRFMITILEETSCIMWPRPVNIKNPIRFVNS